MPKLFRSPVRLAPEARQAQIDALTTTLVNGLAFWHALKVAHWHTKGPMFGPLHPFFGSIADAIDGVNDTVAERVITLGGLVPMSPKLLAEKATISDLPPEETRDLALVGAVAARYDAYLALLQAASAEAIRHPEDPGTINMLAGAIESLEKIDWQLIAHLERGGAG
jgi:DNA-binding ferritin-like protein